MDLGGLGRTHHSSQDGVQTIEVQESGPESRILVQDRFRFKIGDDTIPVMEKPVKSLGRWYRAYLSDKASMKEMLSQAEEWLKALERSGLTGKYKVWCYQHGILPRLLWPLLVRFS